MALVGLAIGLGVWQVERLHWKLGLLADIDRAERSPPAPLGAAPLPFEKVEVSGTLRPNAAARYGTEVRPTVTGPVIGSQQLAVLDRADAAPVLVDLGWRPDSDTAPPPPERAVSVVGYMRPADRASWFTPGDDTAARRFWTLDPARIGATLGIAGLSQFTVVALQPVLPGIEPAAGLPRPPNDHLGYAITWFGLAGSGVIIFIAYLRRTLRP